VQIETRHGVRYTVERAVGAQPQVFTPERLLVGSSPERELFRIDAYSQAEIETVACERASQLELIDRFADQELRALGTKIEGLQSQLDDNAKEILTLEGELATLEDQVTEARTIEEQLRPLQQGSGADAALVKNAHAEKALRERERRAVANVEAAIVKLGGDLGALVGSSRSLAAAAIESDVAKGPNAETFGTLAAQLRRIVDAIEAAATEVGGRCDAAKKTLGDERDALARRHAAQDAAYDALVAKLHEDESRTTERSRLQRRHAEVVGALANVEAKRRKHAEKMEKNQKLLAELIEARGERFRKRASIERMVTERLAPDIRVRVSESENLDEYRAALAAALSDLTNGRPSALVDKLASIMPDDLAMLVRRGDAQTIAERADLKRPPGRANQVIDALSPTHRLLAIEHARVDDVVRIELLHGSVWKDTTQTSPGQCASAILPILLLLTDRPLFVDQPDDDIDEVFMCSAILRRVGELKGARQFFFSTHHANVPLVPDAELVMKLASDGAHGHLLASGTIDEMKEHILLLEGGREAFEQRRKRYEDE